MGNSTGNAILVVLGMHRSGTSAVTGALNCVGIQLGSRLYAGHKGINDKGYFENSDIADLDDEVLLALGSRWDDMLPLAEASWRNLDAAKYSRRLKKLIQRDSKDAELWGVKDPRVCRLLPFWKQVVSEQQLGVNYLHVVRHPTEVALSLQRRDGFSIEKSLVLWIEYNLQAELHSRGESRTAVLYDDLMSDPIRELERIEQSLQVTFPVSTKNAEDAIDDFLTKGLRHHEQAQSSEASVLERVAKDVYGCLCVLARDECGEECRHSLDRLRAEFEEYRNTWPASLIEHLREVAEDYARYRLLWLRVSKSFSWVLGKPVRYMERLFKRDV